MQQYCCKYNERYILRYHFLFFCAIIAGKQKKRCINVSVDTGGAGKCNRITEGISVKNTKERNQVSANAMLIIYGLFVRLGAWRLLC